MYIYIKQGWSWYFQHRMMCCISLRIADTAKILTTACPAGLDPYTFSAHCCTTCVGRIYEVILPDIWGIQRYQAAFPFSAAWGRGSATFDLWSLSRPSSGLAEASKSVNKVEDPGEIAAEGEADSVSKVGNCVKQTCQVQKFLRVRCGNVWSEI